MVSAPYGQATGGPLTRVITETTTLRATGVIYTCRLTPSHCVGLTGDGGGEDRRLYDVDGWYFDVCIHVAMAVTLHIILIDNKIVSFITDGNQGEQKRGQFLGVTLKSTGDTFLVRYFHVIM